MNKGIKTFIALLFAGTAAVLAHAPVTFPAGDGHVKVAIVEYIEGADRYWYKSENKEVAEVNGIAYAYDPKTSVVYVQSVNGNYRVQVPADELARIKKEGKIPELTGPELQIEIERNTRDITSLYDGRNIERGRTVADSMNVAQKERKERELAEFARRQEQARRDEERRRADGGNWRRTPVGGLSFKCLYCDHEEKDADYLNLMAVTSTELYHLEHVDGALGTEFDQLHVYPLREELRSYDPFEEHLRLYRDSLSRSDMSYNRAQVEAFNREQASRQIARMHEKAPYGFLSDVRVCNNRGHLGIDFSFTNMRPSPVTQLVLGITYPDRNYNDINAEFPVEGPLKQYDEARWSFPDSTYPYPTVDGGNLWLRITYADGNVVTLRNSDVVQDGI